MTQKGRRILPLVLALALALTGGLLLWRGADRDGVGVTRLTLDGTVLRLYRLGDAGSETVILTDHADGDGGHTHTLTLGGQSSAALVLTAPGDRSDALAVELARRGVAVLTAPGGSGAAAWDWLTEQNFVRLSTVALVAGPGQGEEALALMGSLSGGGRECAAAVLMEDASLLSAAAGSPGRNILFLALTEPEPHAVAAFLREEERAPGWIGGYFAEGTARKAVRPVSGRWDDREVLLPVIDWLGSSLGHTIELKDNDLIVGRRLACRRWGAACLAGGALALTCLVLPRRKRKEPGMDPA